MSLYKFMLKNLSGCYVGIEASSLKTASEVYKHFVTALDRGSNSVVSQVIKSKECVVYDRKVN